MDMQEFVGWLNERLDKIEAKQDKTNEHCAALDKAQASMAKDLAYHIHRTDLLEEKVDREAEAAAKQIKPLTKAYERGKGVLWFLGLVSLVVGVWLSVTRITG